MGGAVGGWLIRLRHIAAAGHMTQRERRGGSCRRRGDGRGRRRPRQGRERHRVTAAFDDKSVNILINIENRTNDRIGLPHQIGNY